MGRLAGFKYRQVIQRLRALGFVLDRQARGSHEVWRRASTGRTAIVPNHRGDVPEPVVKSIVDQGGVSVDEFLAAK